MTMESKIEAMQNLIEEVKAELAAMRATKRNWPERVEAGMVFQSLGTTATWMATDVDGLFVCLKGETDSFKAAGRTMRLERDNVPHAGHARDILAIRTDAHEPTGAEFLGKCCDFSDDGITWPYTAKCEATSLRLGYTWGAHESWYKFARLAK